MRDVRQLRRGQAVMTSSTLELQPGDLLSRGKHRRARAFGRVAGFDAPRPHAKYVLVQHADGKHAFYLPVELYPAPPLNRMIELISATFTGDIHVPEDGAKLGDLVLQEIGDNRKAITTLIEAALNKRPKKH